MGISRRTTPIITRAGSRCARRCRVRSICPPSGCLSASASAAGKLYASSVGIGFEDEADTGLSLALGGFTTGVTPLSLCNAFTPFANGGYYSQPSCIIRIEDAAGETIYERPDSKVSVLSAETAFLITSVLQTTVSEGTARRLQTDGISIAAKTGTSGSDNISGNKDAWCIAYDPKYTMCCWMGFDSTDEEHCLDYFRNGRNAPGAAAQRSIFGHLRW